MRRRMAKGGNESRDRHHKRQATWAGKHNGKQARRLADKNKPQFFVTGLLAATRENPSQAKSRLALIVRYPGLKKCWPLEIDHSRRL